MHGTATVRCYARTMRWWLLLLGFLSGCAGFLPYVHVGPCDPIFASEDFTQYWIGSKEVEPRNLVEELEQSGERVRVPTLAMMPFGKATMVTLRPGVDWNLVREAIKRHNASRPVECDSLSEAP